MYAKGIQSHLMTKSERRVQLITETMATTTKNSVVHNVVCKKATCCTFIAQSLCLIGFQLKERKTLVKAYCFYRTLLLRFSLPACMWRDCFYQLSGMGNV